MIEVNIETLKFPAGSAAEVSVIRVIGEIDATNAAIVQQKVLPLSVPGCQILLVLADVVYMSSAGLRMLLSLYRQTSAKQGKIVLVGLSDELKDTMAMTGFLGYFTVQDTVENGMQTFS
ncbi:MAG: anti-sigma factor antagonist [Chloroflexi bacterium]|nr:anti-sigma factor antagonist [Chloroflexota bacterium]